MVCSGRGSGGNVTADLLHIALTGVMVLFIFAIVGIGASIRGQSFRRYSIATLLAMLVFGVLTSVVAPGLGRGEPTPWLGLLERINIGAFLLWVAVLAILLWRDQASSDGHQAYAMPTAR
ncbi:MAG TPA: DUF998 domain-containing protein [Polyangiaceae bacterium]|nr:DUF998 domain-containing protein [Polyangiaceae bacterium]